MITYFTIIVAFTGRVAWFSAIAVSHIMALKTRQLSYRKEDRAMRPIYGCTEKFWESSLRTRLHFQKFI